MTPEERHALAESLMANPLLWLLLDEMESGATQATIWAHDDETRLIGALRVQSIQQLRNDCAASLRNTQPRKGAPA